MSLDPEFEAVKARWTGVSMSSPRRGAVPDVLYLIQKVETLLTTTTPPPLKVETLPTPAPELQTAMAQASTVIIPAVITVRCTECSREFQEVGCCVECTTRLKQLAPPLPLHGQLGDPSPTA